MFSKKGVIRWEIVKSYLWSIKKSIIGWEQIGKIGYWYSGTGTRQCGGWPHIPITYF